MQSLDKMPDFTLSQSGPITCCFTAQGINRFHDACRLVQGMPYGDNTIESADALFVDGQGTCISKHRAIAVCAAEQGYEIYQVYGIYPLDEMIVEGVGTILANHGVPFVPAGHCFLAWRDVRVDLTEGNNNGKRGPVDSFLATVRIFAYEPLIKERVYEMSVANVLTFDHRFAGISRTALEAACALCLQQMQRQRCA